MARRDYSRNAMLPELRAGFERTGKVVGQGEDVGH
jgi:hypothetical protein